MIAIIFMMGPNMIELLKLKTYKSPGLLIDVFVSLLFERRIILRSNSLGTLTDVCSALESLLFPFKVCPRKITKNINSIIFDFYQNEIFKQLRNTSYIESLRSSIPFEQLRNILKNYVIRQARQLRSA